MVKQAMKAHRGLDLCLYSFFNFGPRWGSVVNATLRPLYSRNPLYRKMGGHQGRSERVGIISTTSGFDPQTVQPVANFYTDCTFPAHCIEKYFFTKGQ
jgi:hypothetical protein